MLPIASKSNTNIGGFLYVTSVGSAAKSVHAVHRVKRYDVHDANTPFRTVMHMLITSSLALLKSMSSRQVKAGFV
jgi:hypothetical protein